MLRSEFIFNREAYDTILTFCDKLCQVVINCDKLCQLLTVCDIFSHYPVTFNIIYIIYHNL